MTSNDSHAKNGYMCAQDNVSGSMSIGAGKTHSYNINTNSQYFPLYYCDQTTSSSVTVAHGQTWGSASFTATNWLTPSNTRHWSVGILWTAGGYSVTGFSGGCSVNSQVFNNPPAILNISSVSAANIPTGGAQAGQSFSLPVTVSPSSATGIVAVEDNGVPVASATLSGGAATLKWIPAMQGTSKVTVVYKGDSANTPASTSTYTVPVSGGIGVQITSMPLSTTASNTAIANISVSPSTTTGIVALVNTAAGKAIGNAVLSNGSASIPFTFTPGSSYTFIAQYLPSGSSPPTGQSYPYAWNSLSPKRGPALDSVTLNQGLDEMLAGIPQQPTQSTQTVSNLVTASAARPTVSARCPSGTRLINFDALSFGPADAFTVTSQDQSGATAKTAAANYGSKILAQAICRPAGAK
ncbi:MAG: Ig-like domain-containing protein, partial [Gaiellales bacterium]